MSTSRYFDRICAVILVIAVMVTVLFMNGQTIGIELVTDPDSEAHSDSEYFTENDQLSDWDTASASYITLEGDSVSISGNNVYEYDGNVVISGSGKYVISGTLDDGYITVNANANSKVWILLNGVDISCSDNACLRVDEADKVFLTLAEGTTNTLTGGEELSEEALADGTYSVIFAHDDLTINGNGSLQISAGYKHGIKANDDLVITGGTITIDAPADGIHVNDSFRLKEASVEIAAGDDGILTENAESFFYLESGTIAIDAEGDGIHSGGKVMIAGGTIAMDAGDDGIHADGAVEIEDGVIRMDSCYEGIEGATITVSGGDITVYPTDDGFNASSGSSTGGGMTGNPGENPAEGSGEKPAGGFGSTPGNRETDQAGMQPPEEMERTSENPAPDAEEEGAAPDGPGTAPGFENGEMPAAPEGAPEGEMMAKPPAMSESTGMTEEFPEAGTEQQTAAEEVENYINISGGTITIINEKGNDADGLDSNGDLIITGGDIRISLTDNGTNSAIDVATENGGTAEISGGTIIACGSSAMAEAFDSTSTQCSIMYNISAGMESGTYLSAEDKEGTEILSWEVPCSFSSAVISSPDMQIGESYTILADDNEETVTLSEVSASFGDAQSSMFGGSMNWGGMTKRDRGGEGPGGAAPGGLPQGTDTEAMPEFEGAEAAEMENGQTEMSGPGQRAQNAGPMPGGERPSEMNGESPQQQSDNSADSTESTSSASYDANVWIITAFSLLALAAGLLIAKKYRRH